MTFAEPVLLLAVLIAPLALAAQLIAGRRARRDAVRFTAIPSLKLAVSSVPAWRRHVPPALALAALAALAMALAKPQRTVAVPLERASIVLVTDHSRSMLAGDVQPDRLTAAKAAARTFLGQIPARVRVGVVTYSDEPDAVHAPSENHRAIRDVIDQQAADGATATGDALQTAVDTLTQDRRDGHRAPAAIVLLSDGKTTAGRDPVEVADDSPPSEDPDLHGQSRHARRDSPESGVRPAPCRRAGSGDPRAHRGGVRRPGLHGRGREGAVGRVQGARLPAEHPQAAP